jgi:hypothetical protein
MSRDSLFWLTLPGFFGQTFIKPAVIKFGRIVADAPFRTEGAGFRPGFFRRFRSHLLRRCLISMDIIDTGSLEGTLHLHHFRSGHAQQPKGAGKTYPGGSDKLQPRPGEFRGFRVEHQAVPVEAVEDGGEVSCVGG